MGICGLEVSRTTLALHALMKHLCPAADITTAQAVSTPNALPSLNLTNLIQLSWSLGLGICVKWGCVSVRVCFHLTHFAVLMAQLLLDAESYGGSRPQDSRAYLRSSGFSPHTETMALKLERAQMDHAVRHYSRKERTTWGLTCVFSLRLCAFHGKVPENFAKMLFGI